MSHMTSSLAVITDLNVLKEALKHFPKLKWNEGATTYRWFGEFLNDWSDTEKTAGARGIDPSQFGKCSHSISSSDSGYDIGVTNRSDGQGYSLVWDTWSSEGRKLSACIGNDAEKLMTEYNRIYCEKYAQAEGMMTSLNEDEENVTLEMMAV